MRGLTLVEWLVILAIILIICAIALPGLLSSQRASNERGASTTLKTFSSAQADFRANDRDGNGVNDFWTADVKGLYTVTGGRSGNPQLPVKLIHLSSAAADADDATYAAGGKNTPLSAYVAPQAQAGYWYVALLTDRSVKPEEAAYKVDTGGSPPMGKVHHKERFGFAAFPDSLSTGKYAFIVNENNTIFRVHQHGRESFRLGKATLPGLSGLKQECLHWPDDETLKKIASCCD